MGLVEGLAVALDGDMGERTLHQYASAMKEFGIDYDIEKLLSYSGFISQAPAKGYIVCGSFVQYLLDHYGIERFKRTYQSGRFEAGYGRSLQSLIAEWDDFLSQIKILDSDESHVRYSFRRLPVFQKPAPVWLQNGLTKRERSPNKKIILQLQRYTDTPTMKREMKMRCWDICNRNIAVENTTALRLRL